MVGHRQQRVGIRRQVDPDHLGPLVHHHVQETRILVGEPVVVLPPHQGGQQVVQRSHRAAPGDVPAGLQPLGVLVEHRVDDVDERLVAVEQPVPAGEQVALQPALALVLGQHLHDPAVRGQVIIARLDPRVEGPAGGLEHGIEPVGGGLVRPEQPEGPRVAPGHVAQPGAQDPGAFGLTGARLGHLHRVVAEIGQVQVAQQQAAVGVRIGAHPPVGARGQPGQLADQGPVGVEQLFRPVAAHPVLELAQVLRVGARAGDRHLVRAPGALDLEPVHHLRAGPALGRLEHDHRPARPGQVAVPPGPPLDGADLIHHLVQGGGELLVNPVRDVAGHPVHPVAVALQQRHQFVVGDPGQHRRVGDLVPVEVQDRQHGPVLGRVEELVRVPAGGQRPGLRLAVTDHADRDQAGVVEHRAVRVRQRIPEFPALMDRAGCLRRGMARDPAGEGELAEQPGQPGLVPGDARVQLGVGAFQIGVGHDAGPAVPGPGHVDDVQVPVTDHPVEVGVDQVQAGRGPPVTQQARLDVLGPQRLAQQRVAHQVDLAHREIVGGPPVGVEVAEVGV